MLLFCDSFDHYATADIAKKWTSHSSATIGAFGRNSTNGMRHNSNASSFAKKVLGTASANHVVGFSWKTNLIGDTADRILCALYDGSTEQVSVRINSLGKLLVSRAGTTLATGTTVLSSAVAYYIEFKATIGTTGSYTLRINGVTELTSASANTKNTSNATADTLVIGPTTAGGTANMTQIDYDDLVWMDASGSVNNDFLGDARVFCSKPSADGAASQWTPNSGGTHFNRVNEATPDDDTTYLSSPTVNNKDSWAVDDLPGSASLVKAVQMVPYVKKSDAGVRVAAPLLRISGTDYVQPDMVLSTSYQYLPKIVELSPATGVAFTVAEVNAMEVGIKVTG
jgi:hypothetical protein